MLSEEEASLSGLISLMEKNDFNVPEVMSPIFLNVGKAYRVVVTRPAGSRKSTLIGKLPAVMWSKGPIVGIKLGLLKYLYHRGIEQFY